jgi:hypothetical protein
MRTKPIGYTTTILLLGLATSVKASSVWNYTISDAGNGNSLVTWNVSGDMTTPPGVYLTTPPSRIPSSFPITVTAPGIYTGAFQADGTTQNIPTPDGSHFDLYPANVWSPIVGYATDTSVGNGNESFSLIAAPVPGGVQGPFLYTPGTQSIIIPVDFSNFNPGTYQSQDPIFNTPLTVNLTVVPEPSTLTMVAGAGVVIALTGRKKQ